MAAQLIQIFREGSSARIVVDGQELPVNAILHDSVSVPIDPSDIPTVDLQLIAARVEVINTLEERPA